MKVGRVFCQKKEANSIKPSDRKGVRQAFVAFRANPYAKDLPRLPWCITHLELLTAADMSVEKPDNPVTTFPAATTMRNLNCTHSQWADLIEDLLLSLLEEIIKTSKCELPDLKDCFLSSSDLNIPTRRGNVVERF